MSELLFDIFGDRSTKGSTRSLLRQPLSNNENIGKVGSTGPIKPNEPLRKNEPLKKVGDTKKSFLSNTGTALRDIQTPAKQVYSPRSRNVVSSAQKVMNTPVIYTDELDDDTKNFYEELEFTKPAYRNENFYSEMMASLLGPEREVPQPPSPCITPPPALLDRSLEFDCSYEDNFFIDDFAANCDPSPFGEDDLPEIFTP